jgi:hypothetical protein
LGAPVQAPKFVARSDQDVPMEVRTTAFKAPKPAQKPIYESLSLGDGDAAVLALSAVREDPNAAKIQDGDMRRQYAAQVASGEAQSYAAAARADAKITLNPKAID